MRKCVLVLVLCVVAAPALAVDMFHPATGLPHQGGEPPGHRRWSEPPDLNGLIASSEQILQLGLETEIANDFTPLGEIASSTWWGGFYNNSTPCSPGMTTPGFNIRFYEDAGCFPGTIIADESITSFQEESVGCQAGFYPMYRYFADNACALVQAGGLYWFGVQMKDHPFPPQAGRLASMGVVGCDTVFKSAYFGYPDWTPAIDVFGVAFDASQEFQYGLCISDGACCIGDQCEYTGYYDCMEHGGDWQGFVTCSPNPCQATPVKATSWGRIKATYR